MREIKFNWRRKRMREIKFRGKMIDDGEWVVGCLIRASEKESVIVVDVAKGEVQWVFSETVGQYTGLKDKNGKEIYEGDVVWCRAGEHRSGIWEYEKRFVVEYGWSQSMWEMFMCDEIEVIGNIYDNPDLLEVQE